MRAAAAAFVALVTLVTLPRLAAADPAAPVAPPAAAAAPAPAPSSSSPAAASSPGATTAEPDSPIARAARPYTGSPQNFAFELRFGPYYPDVDAAPGLRGAPFAKTFGDNARLLVGAELDWQALRLGRYASLGPGFAIARTGFSRPALFKATGLPSAQKTHFDLTPMALQAVLRVDGLARVAKIPLVPYAKLGLGAGYWRAYGEDGTTVVDGKSGKGVSFGLTYTVGAALLLDVFDRATAAAADEASGINHTYLFGEFQGSNLDNFGSASAMHVGARTWATGLLFEF